MLFRFKNIINIASIIAVASETSTNNTTNTKSRLSKVPCEICGLLFDTVDIKEEHEKLSMLNIKGQVV